MRKNITYGDKTIKYKNKHEKKTDADQKTPKKIDFLI